ncbi:hypothetical protein [Halosimplex halobium]|uniref:hypothetical protein n=1 Tax=Halosimplex halobium TaxID=3396618 RepID=UPI003F570227
MAPDRSIEREILEIVAYFDPIDYHLLKRLTRDRVGAVETEVIRGGLANLKELGLVRREKMHEHIHITDQGWKHLGGETSRYDCSVEAGDTAVCPVCAVDEQVEENWEDCWS